jgi:ribonuclease III
LLQGFFHRVKSFFNNKRLQFILDKRFHSNLGNLESLLGFKIYNQTFYLKALTHRSYLELHHELQKSNERLEFLGDSVLSMIVAKYLFFEFPDEDEGFLTKSRASMVNRSRLFNASEEIGLKEFILFNEKYLRGSHEGFQTIMADCLEALIGAIYLDRGLDEASKFVKKYLISPFEERDSFIADTNYKGQLLEYTHSKKLPSPRYTVVKEEGPSHNKYFVIETYLGDELVGIGNGKNKKMAEQESSKNALQKLQKK